MLANGFEEAAAKRTHDRYVARLRRAWESGVNVVFGTDVMVDPKGTTRGQMAMAHVDSFVEAGIKAMDILRAMTSRAAELLGVAAERGTLRAGFAADLVATPYGRTLAAKLILVVGALLLGTIGLHLRRKNLAHSWSIEVALLLGVLALAGLLVSLPPLM